MRTSPPSSYVYTHFSYESVYMTFVIHRSADRPIPCIRFDILTFVYTDVRADHASDRLLSCRSLDTHCRRDAFADRWISCISRRTTASREWTNLIKSDIRRWQMLLDWGRQPQISLLYRTGLFTASRCETDLRSHHGDTRKVDRGTDFQATCVIYRRMQSDCKRRKACDENRLPQAYIG
jgi:hypothetical protein